VHLSAHPALQGLATSRHSGHRFSFIGAACFTSSTKDSQGDLRLIVRRASIPCRPSPCNWLSQSPSTMAAPTLTGFIDGLLISTSKPPAFTETDSARPCRQRFAANQSCSSQYPEREPGKLSRLLQPVDYRAAWGEGAIHPGSFAAPHHPRSRLRR
jgi:hypothetical protein